MGRSGHSNFGKAEKGTERNEHVKKQNSGKRAAVPSVDPEPKMQTNGEMAPDEKDKEDLAESCPGINPEIGDFVWVIDVDAGENARPARVNDVHQQKIRNRQSQEHLSRFPSGHSVMPPSDESDQTAEGMHRKTSVQKDLAKRRVPEGHHPRPGGFL